MSALPRAHRNRDSYNAWECSRLPIALAATSSSAYTVAGRSNAELRTSCTTEAGCRGILGGFAQPIPMHQRAAPSRTITPARDFPGDRSQQKCSGIACSDDKWVLDGSLWE